MTPGFVSLVGAGPGAADLITLRGLRAIRAADVVLYDALVNPDLVAEARPGALTAAVGKRGYCVGSTSQEHINDLLVRHALAGRRVCRLKGGDPGVFGRGGEEAEALAAAGVPFEFVPGVTAALGAAATALIPLTHRAAGQAVTLATGHHDPDSPDCTLDWPALARTPTLAFYMASRHAGAIAAKLAAHGRPTDTPAAVVTGATTATERVLVSTLADLGRDMAAAALGSPALVIVGEVVRYRAVYQERGGARNEDRAKSEEVCPIE
jgi:uroporphyrin-III C-methyltransferase